MRVVQIEADGGLALCEGEDGDRRTVEIGLIEPVETGAMVLVHADVALTSLETAA
jgi:hydrogenase maturation factor